MEMFLRLLASLHYTANPNPTLEDPPAEEQSKTAESQVLVTLTRKV